MTKSRSRLQIQGRKMKSKISKRSKRRKRRKSIKKIVLHSRKWEAVGWDKRTDDDLKIENNIYLLLTFVTQKELVSTANALEEILVEMEGKQYDSSSKLKSNLQSVWDIFQRWPHPIEFNNAKCNIRLSIDPLRR